MAKSEVIAPSPPPSTPPSQLEANEKPTVDPNLIDFDGPDDPLNALNWPFRKKIITTLLYSFVTMGAAWASTAYNSGIGQVKAQFGVSTEVALLGMSLFLFGNAFGPLLWAPMSEYYGRKPSILLPIFGLTLFCFASATAKDIQTLLITRFFGGLFGGAPLSNTGGVLADIWPATQRGPALLLWGLSVIIGPCIAPIVGSALVTAEPTVGWRWTLYVTGIILGVSLLFSTIYIDESFPPVLLARKANRIRHETKNWAIHSESQEHGTSFSQLSRKYLMMPLEMMIDPIAFAINLYAAFCYAIIFLTIPTFPFEFTQIRHWSAVDSSIPFVAIIVGVIFASFVIMWGAVRYKNQFEANGNKVIPEARLPPMMIGSVFFAGGLFIMAWTAEATTHWIGFCIGAACLGLGFFTIFQSALGYLVDTYLGLAASVIAANMFMRSILAGAFPLFATELFTNLGIDWGMSLLGFLAVAMLPIPYLFFIFGRRIRAVGKHSKKTFVP
ncbi:major facilitator superfamily domain-containing protein [Massariosphaeria phaeospora]|uniref:Major facilitator superfamily domain-containing protein n=1 Tax=Massariosphaeria phaeospora TaxID=100035 RepID=A0A7C8MVU4_9PLEO|nr:major facilitator superfamily domain-containing protein [Massariosphaeria phaeospora]